MILSSSNLSTIFVIIAGSKPTTTHSFSFQTSYVIFVSSISSIYSPEPPTPSIYIPKSTRSHTLSQSEPSMWPWTISHTNGLLATPHWRPCNGTKSTLYLFSNSIISISIKVLVCLSVFPQPNSPAKFCDQCGAQYLRETSKFCSECGSKRLGI